MNCDLVYNPAAGTFREARLAEMVAALESEGMKVQPMATKVTGAQLSGSADVICVAGGDGTLRDTVQAMGDDAGKVPLAIARMGTINLVARELGLSAKPQLLARQIAAAMAHGPDGWLSSPLYKVGDLPIVSCLSIGPDSIAVASVSGQLKRRIGRFAYVVAMMRQLVRWPRAEMRIEGELADGTPFETVAEMVILSRGALYAGPFRLSPEAGLASDTVELITLRRSTRLSMLALSSAAVTRLPIGRMGLAEIRSVRAAHIANGGLPLQVDGDHMPEHSGEITRSAQTLRYIV